MTREELRDYVDEQRTLNNIPYHVYSALIDGIDTLEQEPKTGHWRAIYQGDEIIDYRCSECEFGSTSGKSTYRMHYCPNCGCHMVEPQESEE